MKSYELLTIEEVSRLLRVSERTVYDWAQKGEIPCGKFGTAWRFRKSEVLKWIDSRLKTPRRPALRTPLALSAILSEERVVFLQETTKDDALIHMVDVLATSPQVHNAEDLLANILRREELMSTGIGLGIGVPHARLNSVDDLVVAFGVCRTPLADYASLDSLPVQMIVMIAANVDQHAKHIKALSTVTGLLRDKATCAAILAADTTEAVYRLLTEGSLS